jgi:hypothetical protein
MNDNNTTEAGSSASDEWKQRELGALWRIDGQKQSYYSGSIKDSE